MSRRNVMQRRRELECLNNYCLVILLTFNHQFYSQKQKYYFKLKYKVFKVTTHYDGLGKFKIVTYFTVNQK